MLELLPIQIDCLGPLPVSLPLLRPSHVESEPLHCIYWIDFVCRLKTFLKVHLVKAVLFSVVMYGCKSWTIKKAKHRRIDALELWCWNTLLRVPWTARRSNQSILKEIFIGWTDAKAETPIIWPPDVKNRPTGKDPDAGRDWRQEEKGTTEDKMVGWHQLLDGHEFE